MRSTYNNHCPIKGQMKREGMLFCFFAPSPLLFLKHNSHFPACPSPSDISVALKRQPALAGKQTLVTACYQISGIEDAQRRGRGLQKATASLCFSQVVKSNESKKKNGETKGGRKGGKNEECLRTLGGKYLPRE